jgi:hypothetical protein
MAAAVLTVGGLVPAAASATTTGVEHLSFHAGPYAITPGANQILAQSNGVPKPPGDGFMVRMTANLRYALPNGKCCGAVPRTDVVHLHHGVWFSDGAAGQGEGDGFGPFYPFMATGEEKTAYEFPAGYGYPIGAQDHWVLNYMIHNLTAIPRKVYVTYKIDFVPASSPVASTLTAVHPIWMDVEDHHIYPVFDVKRHSGRNGRFTFPDMATDPYQGGTPLNEFPVDHPGTLVATAGHLHPGGLYDDLDLIRAGATPDKQAIAGSVPNSVRLFRSRADYFGRRPPISWNFAMTATPPDWRPEVKAGDVLRISATYDTNHASWYEVMGIMVVWEAWNDTRGVDPFGGRLDEAGQITHGPLPENRHLGGTAFVGTNPRILPACHPKEVVIAAFRYLPGDISRGGEKGCVPTIRRGQSLEFVNQDADARGTFTWGALFAPNPFYVDSIFHTVTSCQSPCGLNYGTSYPLATGAGNFDSGELGVGTPGIGTLDWSTPTSLKPGTYTFFCRIHPWMRGVFRVIR